MGTSGITVSKVTSSPRGATKTMSTGGDSGGGTPRSSTGRPVEVRKMTHGAVVGSTGPSEGGPKRTSSPQEPALSLSERTRAMLKSIDDHGDLRAVPGKSEAPAAPTGGESEGGDAGGGGEGEASGAPEGGSSAADSAAGASLAESPGSTPEGTAGAAGAGGENKPTVTPAPAPSEKPAPTPDAELTAKVVRLTEHNRRLLAELEKHTGKDDPGEPDERSKELDAIERGFTADPVAMLRRLVALNAGIKDPAAPEVDRLMSGIYADWTGRELKMELDEGKRASIGVERNRLLIERDKREREQQAKAEQTRAEKRARAEAEQRQNDEAASEIERHLTTNKLGDKYPLLTEHLEWLTGVKPGAAIWGEIKRGLAAGELPKDASNDTLINHYAKDIEARIQRHRDRFALPSKPSTATPPPASEPVTESKASPTSPGARAITNASASAAPAKPPTAAPTAPAADSGPPKRRPGEREDAFRKRAASFYFQD